MTDQKHWPLIGLYKKQREKYKIPQLTSVTPPGPHRALKSVLEFNDCDGSVGSDCLRDEI